MEIARPHQSWSELTTAYDDIHGSAEYRTHLIPELTARAVEHCFAGTPGAII